MKLEHCTTIYITSWSRYCWIHEFAYPAVPTYSSISSILNSIAVLRIVQFHVLSILQDGDAGNSDIVGQIFINECTWMNEPPRHTTWTHSLSSISRPRSRTWRLIRSIVGLRSGLRFSVVTSVKPARESVKGNGRKHWCFWSLCVLIRSVAVWGKKCGYGFFEWCYRFHGILWRLTPCKGETCRRGSRTHAWPSDAFGISWYFPVWSVVRRCHISAILGYIYWLIHTFFFGQVWLHYIHLPGHHCVVGYQMILVTGHISTFNPHGSQPQSCLQSCNLRHILSIFKLQSK